MKVRIISHNQEIRNGVLYRTAVLELTDEVILQPTLLKHVEAFTTREKQVLERIHLSNKEIANELSISERTVKYHVSSLLSKTRTTTRAELQRHLQLKVAIEDAQH